MSMSLIVALAAILHFGPMPVLLQSAALAPASPGDGVVEMMDTTQVLLSLATKLERPDARATIIRPAGADVTDIIIVTLETTPTDLEMAVEMLFNSRHSFGHTVDREMVAHVGSAGHVMPEQQIAEVARYLAALRTATEIEIPGFGLQHSLFMKLDR
jgi:hypothetical protein